MCVGDDEMLHWWEEDHSYSLKYFEIAAMLGRHDPPVRKSLRTIRNDWFESKKAKLARSDDRARAVREIVDEGKKYGFDTSFVNDQYCLAA